MPNLSYLVLFHSGQVRNFYLSWTSIKIIISLVDINNSIVTKLLRHRIVIKLVCILMDFPIHIDTISLGLPILYFKGSQVKKKRAAQRSR